MRSETETVLLLACLQWMAEAAWPQVHQQRFAFGQCEAAHQSFGQTVGTDRQAGMFLGTEKQVGTLLEVESSWEDFWEAWWTVGSEWWGVLNEPLCI